MTDTARGFYEKQTGYVLLAPLLQALGSDEVMASSKSPRAHARRFTTQTLQTVLHYKPSQLKVLELEY